VSRSLGSAESLATFSIVCKSAAPRSDNCVSAFAEERNGQASRIMTAAQRRMARNGALLEGAFTGNEYHHRQVKVCERCHAEVWQVSLR